MSLIRGVECAVVENSGLAQARRPECGTDWSAVGSERNFRTLGEVLLDARQLGDALAVRDKRGIGRELLGDFHEREKLEHVPHDQQVKVREC